MSLRVRYRVAKVVTVSLSALSIPLGTYVGFSFGAGRYWEASGVLLLETALVAFDSLLYLWILEQVTSNEHEQGHTARQRAQEAIPQE